MKLNKILSVFAVLSLAVASCAPETYELPEKDVTVDDLAPGLAYSVTVNQTDNSVVLKSLMDKSYQVLWSHPQGRSQENELTLHIPFAGQYTVTFGVMTRGGVVYGEPYSFTIDNLNPSLLEDPLWEVLSGGVGKSKTWVLDIDESGTSRYHTGPLYFYGTDDNWNTVQLGQAAPDGADSWNWCPDFASQASWLLGGTGAMDYGYMTFDLIDGANVTIVDYANGKEYKGTYMMDTDNHTMKITDAVIVHDPGRSDIVTKWGDITILSMNEDGMQLAVLRDNSDEGNCLLSYNFVRQDYVPSEDGGSQEADEITDPYTDDPMDDLTTITTTTITWDLVSGAPYDWYWWNAASQSWESNGFDNLADYSASGWAPVPDASSVGKFSLTMTKTPAGKGQFILVNTDGDTFEGNFTSEDGWVDFGQEIKFFEAKASNWSATVQAQKLRVVHKTVSGGRVSELWLGVPSKTNTAGTVTEYLCIKLCPHSNSGTPAVPATIIPVDNDKILYGNLEGNGNLRIEIFNAWGSGTAADPPIDVTTMGFNEKCAVTFTISGLGTLSEPATAFLMLSSAAGGSGVWSAGNETSVDVEVTGDGTYTVIAPGPGATPDPSSFVFNVDIVGVTSRTDVDLSPGDNNRCPNITATIDKIALDGSEGSEGSGDETPVNPSINVSCDNSKILYGDLEGNGNFRIEVFNTYGSGTANDSPIDISEMGFSEKCVVTFTISGLGTLSEPATAFMMLSSADDGNGVWDPGNANAIDAEVTGDGTYTVQAPGPGATPDASFFVFCIDVRGAGTKTDIDLSAGDDHRCPNVTATIDSIKLD